MTRSEIMRRIKSTGNKSTELALASVFRQLGITGWRRHIKTVGIKPDFVFKRQRLAVFVDGCFWHACEDHCDLTRLAPYWASKVYANWLRDKDQNLKLRAHGWRVLRVWEHELRKGRIHELLSKLTQYEW